MTIMLMLLLLLVLAMPSSTVMLLLMLLAMMPPTIVSLINLKRLLTSSSSSSSLHVTLKNICCGRSFGPLKLTWLIALYAVLWYGLTTTKLTLVEAGSHIRLTQRNNHANISELLDNLLRGYDNSIRPDFGGPPATVEVDIMVRSMGPISEVDMTYSMDCYFRQSWVDKRLAFKGAQATLALSVSMLARIWKPDTYFYNGKQSYLHTITTPNKFVRIHQNGRVLYSSRLTIKAGCPMNLEDFPMDIQKCPLKFGSFGYTTADVIYRWNKERPAVAIAEDMKLSQFDLVDCPAGNLTDVVYKASSPYHENHGHDHHHNYDNSNNNNFSQFANRNNKTLTTFAGPGAKNQHVRGTGIQLDKASGFGVGGGAGGGHIRLESDQS
ncbi:gamma-aminobutyric acid receptor alpha-like, partial [Musca vetustissima]|uniref:gamma-aminobutyric acid receptor alpha-like n=1 Tax=Musca vetustissima TaxID=27455 RepID=UPI002AB6C94A